MAWGRTGHGPPLHDGLVRARGRAGKSLHARHAHTDGLGAIVVILFLLNRGLQFSRQKGEGGGAIRMGAP